jgi:hypothetical protein
LTSWRDPNSELLHHIYTSNKRLNCFYHETLNGLKIYNFGYRQVKLSYYKALSSSPRLILLPIVAVLGHQSACPPPPKRLSAASEVVYLLRFRRKLKLAALHRPTPITTRRLLTIHLAFFDCTCNIAKRNKRSQHNSTCFTQLQA